MPARPRINGSGIIVTLIVIFMLSGPPADYAGGFGRDGYQSEYPYEYECEECGEVWGTLELFDGLTCENCGGWCELLED
jgi:hypothetical protein